MKKLDEKQKEVVRELMHYQAHLIMIRSSRDNVVYVGGETESRCENKIKELRSQLGLDELPKQKLGLKNE